MAEAAGYFDAQRFAFVRPPEMDGAKKVHAAVVVGAGPVGLTLTLTLARHGVPCVLLDDDDAVCAGSRAVGMSRRTLEIWDAVGAVGEIAAHGRWWHSGRSFHRGRTVLEFRMPDDPALQYRPMFNIQQFHTERYLVAALARSTLVDMRWQSRFVGVTQHADHASVEVETPQGRYELDARYVIACDGARSAVRSAMGLELVGTSYEAAYVIADIKLETDSPMERRCWFDPPSNPGSTILMHGQPDGVWRLDYQLREGEDAAAAVLPENVIPRVQMHLDLIGERGAWSLEWVSLYRVHSRGLKAFRHGHVFFAGDAAHLMPIFGIRGLNSGVEDAWNLGWKIAYVEKGLAPDALLDSYSTERRAVFLENAALAERNAWFMTPPTRGVRLMRDAVLSLAPRCAQVQDIINPKQAAYVPLRDSPLSTADDALATFESGPAPGEVAPDMKVAAIGSTTTDGYLHSLLDERCAGIYFSGDRGSSSATAAALARLEQKYPLRTIVVARSDSGTLPRAHIVDEDGAVHERFGARADTFYLVRPDQSVAARWRAFDAAAVGAALDRMLCRAGAPLQSKESA